MTEKLRESLSALMDGESEDLELRRVLAHTDSESIDQTWSKYHRTREALGGHPGAFLHLDVSKKVSAAIAQETIDESTLAHQSEQPKWYRPITSFSIAASVAVATVIGVQSYNGGLTAEDVVEQPNIASRVYPSGVSSNRSGSQAVSAGVGVQALGPVGSSQITADLAAQERLEKYMLRHTERAVLNNSKGLIPYARVVSFDSEP